MGLFLILKFTAVAITPIQKPRVQVLLHLNNTPANPNAEHHPVVLIFSNPEHTLEERLQTRELFLETLRQARAGANANP